MASRGSITHGVAGASDYESGGQEFESLRARHYLATTYRAKITGLLRHLQGSQGPTPTIPETQRFLAGTFQSLVLTSAWVRARQAHNLKVIGSNPIPATRKKPVNSMGWRAFSCSKLSLLSQNVPAQQMLVNTRLSEAVASYVGSSMSHVRHMKREPPFVKRSCLREKTGRQHSHRMPVRSVARSKRTGRRTTR